MNRELDLNAQSVHRAIEEQTKREGIKPKPVKPLEAPVLAQPHTAIYKMHRYYARRPHNVFAKLIEHYTNPGDIILDPFCGGGVTVVEGLKLRRRVVGVDINPLATWITKVEVEPVDLDKLQTDFSEWHRWCEEKVAPLFKAKCTKCGKMAVAEWFEWSNVVRCPNCEKAVVLGETKKLPNAVYECTNKRCRARIRPDDCERLEDKMLSVYINCSSCSERYIRASLPGDVKRAKSIAREEKSTVRKTKLKIPSDNFPDMNSVRENNLYSKGFYKFRDFFTPRQRISLGIIKKWLSVHCREDGNSTALLQVFSATLRFVNKMVIRSEAWRGEKPLEWAGHVYWPAYTYLEASPLDPMRKRYVALRAGKRQQEDSIGIFYRAVKGNNPWADITKSATCWLLTQSAHELPMPDESIDAIITDPPFGGNVQYGELSDFYLVWIEEFLGLKNGVEKQFEAIETRHQGFDGAKDRAFYEEMLFKVFKECRRVIKADGWLVLTFHNKDVGVWMAMNRAAIRAGFRLPPVEQSKNRGMVYQPPIQNYTQTIHQKRTGSMLGDFILSFRPVEPATELDAIRENLSSEEEKELQSKCEEIIRFHGGADETTLMTGLLPYLSERGLLARLARFNLRLLMNNGPFVYSKPDKKWYMSYMMREGVPLAPMAMIPAEEATERLVFSYLSDKKQATLDDLLVVIYSQLVNSYRPQVSTIDRVLTKYCKKIKRKGQKRELYVWDPRKKTPDEVKRILEAQLPLTLDVSTAIDHNTIIATLCQFASSRGLLVHVGQTEQRKSPMLAALSVALTNVDLGLPPKAFRIIKEIDLIILKDSTMLAAVEVATTISTFNKAINDRFRNLITVAPNLNIALNVLVRTEDFKRAHEELYSPANVEAGLSAKVKLHTIAKIDEQGFFDEILGKSS